MTAKIRMEVNIACARIVCNSFCAWIVLNVGFGRAIPIKLSNSSVFDENATKEFINSTLKHVLNNSTENDISFLSKLQKVQMSIYCEFILRGLSTIFSGIGLILLIELELPSTIKFFIHKNMLLTNLFSNFLFFFYHDDILYKIQQIRWLCTLFSFLAYYIYTAVFTWMLNEGINICFKLCSVFNTLSGKKTQFFYCFIGWGFPALIHGVLLYIFFEQINDAYFCGILPDTIFKREEVIITKYHSWIYKGPVAAILLVNTICFIFILFIVTRSVFNKIRPYSNLKKFGATLRSALAIYPLLGVTCILYLVPNSEDGTLEFTSIINGIMGLVFFLFHIILDKQVRVAFIKQVFSRNLTTMLLCRKAMVHGFKEPGTRFKLDTNVLTNSSNENSPVFNSRFTILKSSSVIIDLEKLGKRTSKFVYGHQSEPALVSSENTSYLFARKSSTPFVDIRKSVSIDENCYSEVSCL
ncbi:adhesion G-protein coupled receptor D1 isoform X6 [Hydra vulgaris]|uniref:Adhesion G-protein coupled receptor D1 isoform X6 n=2 Tax=Hydra vulgaris TaxID=6087 RepID=A0ABM4BIZ2_HYDVU